MDGENSTVKHTRDISKQQPQSRLDYSMIVVRMATGVKKHFHIRATEWVMLLPAVGLGLILLENPETFSAATSYRILASWAHETTWSFFVLLCALIRIAALGVNGTFQGFGVSPHMRLGASFVGAVFWSQYALGFLIAAYTGNATYAAPLFASTFCMMEILNISRSWSDVVSRRR